MFNRMLYQPLTALLPQKPVTITLIDVKINENLRRKRGVQLIKGTVLLTLKSELWQSQTLAQTWEAVVLLTLKSELWQSYLLRRLADIWSC